MLDASELRIGNFVYYGKSIRPITAIHDNPQRRVVGVDNILTSFEVIEPIPLTPELLEKCGFEKREPEGWYRKGFMDIFDGKPFHYASGNNLCPDILYLHQLQNLYFALTREEL